jgi:hypothetical protein
LRSERARAVLALLPAALPFWWILHSGRIPNLDYWWFFPRFFGADGLATDWASWFSGPNEHLLAGSYALYALNLLITRGSNVGLGLLALAAALGQYILLWRYVCGSEGGVGFWRAAGLAAFCFAPSAAQLWIVGFSGVHWCFANLFVVAALLALLRYLQGSSRANFAAHVACGLLATSFFGSALALWPVSLLAIAWHGRRRLALAYALGCAALLVAYRAATSGAAPSLDSLPTRAVFAGGFLGGLFTFRLELACALALAGLVVLGASVWRARSFPPTRGEWLWLLLAAFALGNAVLAALGRGAAVSSRYTLVAALFWLALLQLLWQTRFRRAAAVAALLMIAALARVGIAYSRPLLLRASLQPLVELTAKLEIEDPDLIRAVVTNDPSAWRDAVPVLRAHRLVPFDSPSLLCGAATSIGQRLDVPERRRRDGGRIDRVDRLASGARFSGFLAGPIESGACLAALDEHGVVRGLGAPTLPTPSGRRRFLGYLRFADSSARIRAVLLDSTGWRGLAGEIDLASIAPAEKPDPTFLLLRQAGRWYSRGVTAAGPGVGEEG